MNKADIISSLLAFCVTIIFAVSIGGNWSPSDRMTYAENSSNITSHNFNLTIQNTNGIPDLPGENKSTVLGENYTNLTSLSNHNINSTFNGTASEDAPNIKSLITPKNYTAFVVFSGNLSGKKNPKILKNLSSSAERSSQTEDQASNQEQGNSNNEQSKQISNKDEASSTSGSVENGLESPTKESNSVNEATSPDTSPLKVVNISPPNGAADVQVTTSISASFNKAVDPATVSSSTFLLRDGGGHVVGGTAGFLSSMNAAFFYPSSPLAQSTKYTAFITTGVTDTLGNHLASAKRWSFTTVSPSMPPTPNPPSNPPPCVAPDTCAGQPNGGQPNGGQPNGGLRGLGGIGSTNNSGIVEHLGGQSGGLRGLGGIGSTNNGGLAEQTGGTTQYPRKVTITLNFLSIDVYDDHEGFLSGNGEYDLYALAGVSKHNTIPHVYDLTDLSVAHRLWDVSDHERVNFDPLDIQVNYYLNGPTVESDYGPPPNNKLTYYFKVFGWEVDGCGRWKKPDNFDPTDIVGNVACLGNLSGVNENDRLGDVDRTFSFDWPAKFGKQVFTESQESSSGDYKINYQISLETEAPPPQK